MQLDFTWLRPDSSSEFRIVEAGTESVLSDDVLEGYRAEAMGRRHDQSLPTTQQSASESVVLCVARKEAVEPGGWERFPGVELSKGLFLEFSRLDGQASSDVVSFANRCGPLALRTQIQLRQGASASIMYADTLAAWRTEIDAMKRMVALWTELADPIHNRSPLVKPEWNSPAKSAAISDLLVYKTRPVRVFVHLKARKGSVIERIRLYDKRAGVNLELEGLVEQKDSWRLLQSYVSLELSRHLEDCAFGVRPIEDDDAFSISMTPRAKTLAAWMWYEAAHMWSIDSDYRVCKWCGMPFLALPRTRRKPGVEPKRRNTRARTDLVYHPDCQVRAARARMDGADDPDGDHGTD